MVELRRVTLSEEYSKKWNTNLTDYFHLYLNGEKISDTLYRKGMFGGRFKDGYCLLLKHTEQKEHLYSVWCVINENGAEKFVADNMLDGISLTGGQICSVKDKFYNIETGVLYCQSYSCMVSEDFVFLDNKYDKNKYNRGILKINKKDGKFELFR